MIGLALNRIANNIASNLYWLRHEGAVKLHDGEFKPSDVEQVVVSAPCLRLAYTAIDDIIQTSGAQVKAKLDMVAILIAKDCELTVDGAKEFYFKNQIVTMMLEGLIPFITANSFNGNAIDNSQKPYARSLYQGEKSGTNIALWAINWQQPILFNALAGQNEQAIDLREGRWNEFI